MSYTGPSNQESESPEEVAQDSLNLLDQFIPTVVAMSIEAAESIEKGMSQELQDQALTQLVEGVEVIVDTIQTIKYSLKLFQVGVVNLLEVDLNSIFTDLLESRVRGESGYTIELLRTHIPENLEDWRKDGVPALRAEISIA